MTSKKELIDLLELYKQIWQNLPEDIDPIYSFLLHSDEAVIYSRSNFVGHITNSAFIYDPNKKQLLLLQHKILKRWLQPGGHADVSDIHLIAGARREASEESGIGEHSLQLFPVHSIADVPFDIDSHHIPANLKKNEDAHVHHDVRYLFLYHGDRSNVMNDAESTGMQWVHIDQVNYDNAFQRVANKIRLLFPN